jgi:concanavalin A-like lectin/glucanase superfamily protein
MVRAGSRLQLVASGAWLVLAACPQLATDDFEEQAAAGAEPDAGLSSMRGGGAGGIGGSGGRGGSGAGGVADGSPGTETPDASLAPLDALALSLVHRYDLDGTGTAVVDSLGGEPGFVWNTALDDRGFVSLAGDDQYVSLPNGVLSSGNDRTLEAWLTWRGGAAWQRVFDFGSSDRGELNQGIGVTYLSLAATSDAGLMTALWRVAGGREVRLTAPEALPIGVLAHVAVVVDSARNSLTLYLNGRSSATTTVAERLAGITDVNVWLGRSQFAADPSLDGDLTRFSIYDRALDADELAASYALGPDGTLSNEPGAD